MVFSREVADGHSSTDRDGVRVGVKGSEKVAIVDHRPATTAEWDEAYADAASPSFEQSSAWSRVWEQQAGAAHRTETRLIVFSDDVRVVLPVSSQPFARGALRRHNAIGWLTDKPLDGAHTRALVTYARKELGFVRWELGPEQASQLGHAVTAGELRFEETRLVPLHRDFEVVVASWAGDCRRRIRRAQEDGVVVERAADIEDWRGWYTAYRDQVERWGDDMEGRPYEYAFFNALRELDSPDVDLWIAKHRDVVVAGSLCFSTRRRTTYFHGVSNRDGLKLSAMNLLLSNAMQHACSKHHTTFDLGTSLGLRGLEAFKDSFSPIVVPRVILRLGRPWHRLAMRL